MPAAKDPVALYFHTEEEFAGRRRKIRQGVVMLMGNAFVALVDKASPWAVNIVVLAVGIAVLVWVWSTVTAIRKSISSQATADRLLTLQNEYNELNNENVVMKEKYNQACSIQAGIKSTHAELKYLFYEFASRQDIQPQSYGILKLITDRLSTDLKFSAGEIHRCAIWAPINDRLLGILAASAGFPDNYRTQRFLEIDGSVAGRCFRTRNSTIIPKVSEDREFRHNPNSPHTYNSLICVPIMFGNICLGVLTVDGKEENAFKSEDIETVEIYAEMVAMVKMMQIASTLPHMREEGINEDQGQNN